MSIFSSGLLPMQLGTPAAAVTGDDIDFFETKLGNLYEIDGKIYRLVKAAAAISTPSKFIVATALSSGAPTWSVNTTTTANDHLVAGVIPSDYSATIASGSYFFIQVSGAAQVVSAGAFSAGALVGSSTTAGRADDASVAAGVGAIGVALEAASGAAETIDVLLKGLV